MNTSGECANWAGRGGERPPMGASELLARIAAVGLQMLALSHACQASPLLTARPLIRDADSMPKVGMKLRRAPAHTHHHHLFTPPASCPKPIGPLPASNPPAPEWPPSAIRSSILVCDLRSTSALLLQAGASFARRSSRCVALRAPAACKANIAKNWAGAFARASPGLSRSQDAIPRSPVHVVC